MLTVNKLTDIFNELIKEGKGDFIVEFSTQDGSSYTLTDAKNIVVQDKWKTVFIG